MNTQEKQWTKHIRDKKIIAIDPGKNGGIAVYSIDTDEVIAVYAMPETMADINTIISQWKFNSRCYMEKVGGIPGQGGASSMFNFGRGFGWIEMSLHTNKIPVVEVTPQKWQKALQLGSKGKRSTPEWKNHLKQRAQQLYPTVEKQFEIKYKKEWLCIADALLILEYARLNEIKR